MKIETDTVKCTANVILPYSDFDSGAKGAIQEIFNFIGDEAGEVVDNVNEYLRVFSDKKYGIDFNQPDLFESSVDSDEVIINFPIRRI